MRVFIQELQQSVEIDQNTFDITSQVLGNFDFVLKKIFDKKEQLQLNATHRVDLFEDYVHFFKIHTASAIVFGGLLLVGDSIFRLNHPDASKFEDLTTDELVKTQAYQEYGSTNEFIEKFDAVVKAINPNTVDEAYFELERLAKRLSKVTFNDVILKNLYGVLNLTSSQIKSAIAPQLTIDRKNEKCISVFISNDAQKALIYFNGSDDEYELLDNWLSTKELRLPMNPDGDSFVVENKHEFLEWYNGLRSRLESECSYATLNSYIDTFEQDVIDKYKKNVDKKLTAIASANAEKIIEVRLRVIDFLNGVLNSREYASKKVFELFTIEQLEASIMSDQRNYLLSIYN